MADWCAPAPTCRQDTGLLAVDGLVTATLGYDGQGNRVIRCMKGETRLYLEDRFETDTSLNYVRYYHFNGKRGPL
jgi:hypothetical protein